MNELQPCIWTARQDPLEALLPEAATAAAAGYAHTLLLGESGAVWAVGSNQFGQLGLGREGGAAQPHPRLVRALRGAALRGAARTAGLLLQGLRPALHATATACAAGHPLLFHRFPTSCGSRSRALAAAPAAHAPGCARPCCSTADMRMHAAMPSGLSCLSSRPAGGRGALMRHACPCMAGTAVSAHRLGGVRHGLAADCVGPRGRPVVPAGGQGGPRCQPP